MTETSYDLTSAFTSVALYFHESDLVEYVREDACCVYKRIDETLTLALEMDTRLPIGFRIKGFKKLYLKCRQEGDDFTKIVSIIEKATLDAGNRLFSADMRIGYRCAVDIARADDVKVDPDELMAA